MATGMASAQPIRDQDQAREWMAARLFRTGPPRLVGIELEWLVVDPHSPDRPLSREELLAALGPYAPRSLAGPDGPEPLLLPTGSPLTCEPGGQVEISTPPHPTLSALLAAAREDLAVLDARLHEHGLVRSPHATDPVRPPRRMVDTPRYRAMQRTFDRHSTAGLQMMGGCAGLQVCVDAGPVAGPGSVVDRWRALHRIGPALVAAFANSARREAAWTGYVSTRMATWFRVDPRRTDPLCPNPRDADHLVSEYTETALALPLLCVRRDDGEWDVDDVIAGPGAGTAPSFAAWIDDPAIAGIGRPPTTDDLGYHLTTLFPPVRAQGHLEVRYLDAQPGDGWDVPSAVVTALMADPVTTDRAADLAAATAGRWDDAARAGLADTTVRDAAVALISLAADRLPELGADAEVVSSVHAAADRCAAGVYPRPDLLTRAGG